MLVLILQASSMTKLHQQLLKSLVTCSLLKKKSLHSYPFDWRTKKPIIWRAVPQWFASVSKFRQEILDEIEKVKFHSEWGKVRLYNMIRDRGDWVISRQRAWEFHFQSSMPKTEHQS